MKSLLVTGGAGFIGSHIANHAASAGARVLVVDNLATGKKENLHDSVELLEADITDERGTWIDRVRDFAPGTISHHAAQTSVPKSIGDPLSDARANVLGTLVMLELCKSMANQTHSHQAEPLRFVYASTGGAICGDVPEGSLGLEHTLPSPQSPYGVSKLTGELYIRAAGRQGIVKPTILRYANIYGPRQSSEGEAGVIATFCRCLNEGRKVTVFGMHKAGDGGCQRDYVYVGDVVRAHAAAAREAFVDEVVNVATGIGTTTETVFRLLKEISGRSVSVHQAPPRPGDIARSVLDPKRLHETVGRTTPLAQGLSETWHALSSTLLRSR